MKTLSRLSICLACCLIPLSGCNSDSHPTDAASLAEAAFEAVRDGDPAAFAALAFDAESLAATAAGMAVDTPQQQEIHDELLGFDLAEVATNTKAFYAKLREQLTADGLDPADAEYRGIVKTKDRFEVPGASCRSVTFELRFPARRYFVRLDMAAGDAGARLFDARLQTYDTVSVEFTSPEGAPYQAVAKMDLDYAVAFDAEAANAAGAWLQIKYDGKNAGMVAGTSLESPYTSDLPGKVLTSGTHVLECLVHPSGPATEHPIGEARLEIVVH